MTETQLAATEQTPNNAVMIDGGDPHATHDRGAPRRPLRIAMVHLSDFRFDSRIQRQAYALAERGDTVDLICLGDPDVIRVGDGLIRINPVGGDKPAGGMGAYMRGYAKFLAAATWKLSVLDAKRRFDLIEIHNMPDALTLAAALPKARRVPVVLNLHDTFPELLASKFKRRWDGWEVRVLEVEERLSAGMATALITVTEEARVRLAERGVGIGRTHIVMNSPDEGLFGPPREPIAPPAEGEIRILYHGGLARRYGVETLVRAFEHLSSSADRVTLRICGNGEDLPMIRELAAAIAPDRIDVAGPVPFETIPAELAAATIGVVPTLHDRFTELLLPVKLLECVHMGLPTLASRLSGISSYFSDEEVRLFAPGDPRELAMGIEEICTHPLAAQERAARATERLKSIAWDQQRAVYLDLVDALTSRRAALRAA